MARAHRKVAPKIPISLLLVEGDTDVIFYERVKAACLSTGQCRVVIQNLKGLFNINTKVVDKLYSYCQQHHDELVKAYCCLDRESRYGETPGFDLSEIIRNVGEQGTVVEVATGTLDEIVDPGELHLLYQPGRKGSHVGEPFLSGTDTVPHRGFVIERLHAGILDDGGFLSCPLCERLG